ncbi:unnamed protein product [Rotaria sordida]|uniref:Uncharacterized protein n=1 Tax=Rotaria sordida TaxID=392033 RepID=A0A818LIA5_9BILA|nr:unnamed protein product [Rotaria sordida]
MLLENCYSHILHNSVKYARCELTIDVEQVLLSIYSHFSRSAKQQSVLLFDQVKAIIDTQNTTTTNNCNDDEEDDDNEHSTTYKIVRIDQL